VLRTFRGLPYAPFADLLRGRAEFAELLPALIETPSAPDAEQQKRRPACGAAWVDATRQTHCWTRLARCWPSSR
jgi:hypothetical protein